MHSASVQGRAHCLLAAGLAALSCGESFTESAPAGDDAGMSPDAGPGPEPERVALDDVPRAFADASCATFARCLGPLSEVFVSGDSCAQELARTVEDQGWNDLGRAVEEGRVLFDGTAVPGCIAALEARSCEDTTDRALPECEAALVGTAALGESCTVDEECTGAALCDRSEGCPGVCTTLRRPGEACASDDMCVDGLACSELTGLCVRPAKLGDACGGGVEPECDLGLFCAGEAEEEGTAGECVAIDDIFSGAEGDACDIERELCGEGLACVVDPGGALAFVCRAKAGAGEPCSVGVPDQCPADHYCTARIAIGLLDGTCAPLPKAGEECVETWLGRSCAAGAVCDPEGECVDRARLGEPCRFAEMCYSGSCEGGACTAGNHCN